MNTAANTASNTNQTFTAKWTKVHAQPRTYGRIARLTLTNPYTGLASTRTTALRIDGRNGTYRVDICEYPTLWTAIDDGQGFSTLAEAKRYAAAWCHLAQRKGTTSPNPHDLRAAA